MKSFQLHTRINTWPQYIPIHNPLPLGKDVKEDQGGRLASHIFSEKNKEDRAVLVTNLLSR